MRIKRFKDRHRGETCYILGNGPSLNDIDLHSLRGVTFGTNKIFMAGYVPTYYVAVNPKVIDQVKDEIKELDCEKFLPEDLSRFPVNPKVCPTAP